MKTIKGPKPKRPPPPPGTEDVSAGVLCFYEVAEAADKLEEFLGRHASVNGTGAINISVGEPGIVNELAALMNGLQTALRPYRKGKAIADAAELSKN